mmetsp:Transcript_5154/g.6716  ORF Transcript_5154/g.6716 Transcript_5154/m.6716 type:complete len:189 (-) Transcript_5154:2325-2891(-)|eukprot:CAMPEP_0198138224 /NCGR_PEP_ID=MMETSP1443-20131203/1638_2 /TAXON_ID=186043 /ORGANISM="Entomoneis sp., Strain CCMP2396" /LENGTH=188 /DNA_ID=CAMNT_0043799909 /DNA_START=272 /DNA_END=838 /DNA_ORIENTATION=-
MANSGSSLNDSKNSAQLSSHSSRNGDCEDELAVSRRGELPTKQSSQSSQMSQMTTLIGTGTVEEQLKGLAKEEEKSWNYLDSVHSRTSYCAGKYYMDGNNNNSNDASSDSLTLDDSCASFASFGGSGGGDDDSECSDHMVEKAAFTNLEPEMTPRRKLLAIQRPSTRMIRAPSSRWSNLQLIKEGDDL